MLTHPVGAVDDAPSTASADGAAPTAAACPRAAARRGCEGRDRQRVRSRRGDRRRGVACARPGRHRRPGRPGRHRRRQRSAAQRDGRRASAARRRGTRADHPLTLLRACSLDAVVAATATDARRAKLGRARVVLARGAWSLAAAGRTYVFARWTAPARRLRAGRRLRAELRMVATDAAGNRRTVTRRIELGR